ncbi:unnamed protein product [Gordionus sp. m RMFG-2023]|uniref:vacuolar protein-sorting-associated protein 25-like n=1 Tax=Gordionus sp. m RMFG-2023 TaxID=3053472 RepID=UPI0030E3716D
MSNNVDKFKTPWLYEFPPYYTIQLNQNTRTKQLDSWVQFVLSYCKHFKCFELNPKHEPSSHFINLEYDNKIILFKNHTINRNLSEEGIILILDELYIKGNFRWHDRHNKTKGGYVLWYSIEEWANVIYKWAMNKGLKNTVCTFYEMIEAPVNNFSAINEFWGMPKNLFLQILKQLEAQKKAEIIIQQDLEGVKFF